jgi:hypothetical protein
MPRGVSLIWLRRLIRRVYWVSCVVVTMTLIVVLVMVRFWVLDGQASGYARIAGGTTARYDISQGDRRLMVAVPPGGGLDADGPTFVHRMLLRFMSFNPTSGTNTSGLSNEFIGHIVYSDYDRLFVDAYNKAKERAIRSKVDSSKESNGER